MKAIFFLFLTLTFFSLNAQDLIVKNNIIESQNYNYDSKLDMHSINTSTNKIKTGVEIYNGYLLLDMGDYKGQEKLTIDLSYSSPKQIQDQGKISLLLYNSNKTEILSREDYYITNESKFLNLDLASFYSKGDNVRLAFYASSGDVFIKEGSQLKLTNISMHEEIVIGKNQDKEKSFSSLLRLYPNPVTFGQLTIEVGEYKKNEILQVYNVIGKLVLEQTINGNKTIINTSKLAKGVYFVKLSTSTNKIIKKIIIE